MVKNISEKLIQNLKKGYCTPQIGRIAKKITEASSTIHYNLKKLENDGTIKGYKAIFDYKKIKMSYCSYIMINLSQEEYLDPEKVAFEIAKEDCVESVDICTGDYELFVKIRNENIDDYYEFMKIALKKYKFAKTKSIASLKQIKSEFLTNENL